MKLQILDHIPPNFLTTSPDKLTEVLSGPTLIHLKGAKTPPLLIVTLLHGNETTGFLALQQLLKSYSAKPLPRSLFIFIGNIPAAAHNLRRLDHQKDFNRVWSGGNDPEHYIASQVTTIMKKEGVFASVDIHNNTGKNPEYACINRLNHDCIALAHLFSDIMVYFKEPHAVQSKVFADFCPATAVECGLPGEPHGIKHALNFLNKLLSIESITDLEFDYSKLRIFHAHARIMVPDNLEVSFDPSKNGVDAYILDKIEQYNLKLLQEDTLIGRTIGSNFKFQIISDKLEDISGDYFSYTNKEIRIKKPFIPVMLTKNIRVIHQDCFGYILNPFDGPNLPAI